MTDRWTLELEPAPGWPIPFPQRVGQFIKAALRCYGIRVVRAVENEAKPEKPQLLQSATNGTQEPVDES
jgi:hypothetical protein